MKAILNFISQKEVYGLLLVILIGGLILKYSPMLIDKLLNKGKNEFDKKRIKTICTLFNSVIKTIIIIILVIIVLELYGVNTRSLVTGLGAAGVIFGLAFQDTLKDLIGGVAAILDGYFIVGDLIEINGFKGEVIQMGLRTTKVRKATGEIQTIANRNLSSVINYSAKTPVLYITLNVAYEEPTNKVEKSLNKAIEKINKLDIVSHSSAKYLGIDSLSSSSVDYLLSVESIRQKQFALKREVLKIVKDQFEKDNIKIPYDQIEVHNGQKI